MTLAFSTLYLNQEKCQDVIDWLYYIKGKTTLMLLKPLEQIFLCVRVHACMCLLVFVCCVPLLEVSVDDSAGEALPADPDTLQNTITPELVDNQEVLHQTW